MKTSAAYRGRKSLRQGSPVRAMRSQSLVVLGDQLGRRLLLVSMIHPPQTTISRDPSASWHNQRYGVHNQIRRNLSLVYLYWIEI
jgi:hypothetical protein